MAAPTLARKSREKAEIVFSEPCRFTRWPDIPIHVLAGRDDRFFSIEFQQRHASPLPLSLEHNRDVVCWSTASPRSVSRSVLSKKASQLSRNQPMRPPPGLPQRQLFRIQQTCPARASLKASSTRVQCNASSTASAPGAEHNITRGMLARTLRVITSRSRYQRNRR